jgi:hypothetical protein
MMNDFLRAPPEACGRHRTAHGYLNMIYFGRGTSAPLATPASQDHRQFCGAGWLACGPCDISVAAAN